MDLNTVDINVIAPFVVNLLKRKGGVPMSSNEILKEISASSITHSVSGIRLRRIINWLRSESLLPILSGNYGYWISYDPIEIDLNVNSLRLRAAAIINAADGLARLNKDFIKQN